MDPAKAKAEKEERERQLKVIREAAEEEVRLQILSEESHQRVIQLRESGDLIQEHDLQLFNFIAKERIRQAWENFLDCSPIPDLSELSQTNSYFMEWIQNCERGIIQMETVFKYTPEILKLLENIEHFLQFPPDDIQVQNLIQLGIIYHEIKRKEENFIERSSYNILHDAHNLFDPEVGLIESHIQIPQVIHCLWSNFYSCPEYTGHFFSQVNFQFQIPEILIMTKGAYRLIKYEYDPYSDSSKSFFPPMATHFLKTLSFISLFLKLGCGAIQNWIWWKESLLLSISKSSKFPQVDGDEGAAVTGVEIDGVEAVNEEQVSESFLLRRKWKSMRMRNKKTTEDERQEEKSSGGSEVESFKGQTTLLRDPHPQPENGMSRDDVRNEIQIKKIEINEQEVSEERRKNEVEVRESGTTRTEKKGRRGKGKGDVKAGQMKTEAELAKERERKEKAAFLPPNLHPDELNLRNYRILGGIYDFKLLEIPAQPRKIGVDEIWTLHHNSLDGGTMISFPNVSVEEEDGCLSEIPFVSDYTPPPSYDLQEVKRTPEEMEKEAKRQEEELQKLVLVEIKVPKTALWFEPPTIVRWEARNRYWSSDGFFDSRFNEDSLQLSFRMTRFGSIGLGHNRWSNLPFQSWELRPLRQNALVLSIMAAVAVLEFTVKDELVCISSLQNVGNSSVVEMSLMNKYMKPHELIQTLRSQGLDIFPETDSYAYVDGILVKHPSAEEHLYQCMATAAAAFNFHWSRWNLLAGRDKMVYQIRERHGTTTPGNYQIVLNTPQSAGLIDCTEVSPNYSEDTAGEYEVRNLLLKYHADLLHLVDSIASQAAKEEMRNVSGQFIEATRILLTSIKPLSFA